jgi:long-chain acyl-CoA synthetase
MMHPGRHAARAPDAPAVIMGGSGRVLTYGALEEGSNRLAHLFRAAGLGRRDHVAVLLENDPRFLEVCWAAQRAGLLYTPVNWHLSPDEAAYVVDDCGARVLITSAAQGGLARALAARTPRVARRLVLGGELPGHASYEAAVAAFPPTPIADECEGAAMLYSSGTTGHPKGVVPAPVDAPFGTPPSRWTISE